MRRCLKGPWRRLVPGAFGVLLVLASPPRAPGCTTILIGKALTADGSVIHAQNEDMGNDAVGRLWWVPSARHVAGGQLDVPYVELPQVQVSAGYWASGNAQGGVGLGTAVQDRAYDSVLVGLNQHGVALSCNWAHSREDNLESVVLLTADQDVGVPLFMVRSCELDTR